MPFFSSFKSLSRLSKNIFFNLFITSWGSFNSFFFLIVSFLFSLISLFSLVKGFKYLLKILSNSSSSIGLDRYSSNPKDKNLSLSPCKAFAVKATIGVWGMFSCFSTSKIFFKAPTPLTIGILISIKIKS